MSKTMIEVSDVSMRFRMNTSRGLRSIPLMGIPCVRVVTLPSVIAAASKDWAVKIPPVSALRSSIVTVPALGR